MRAGRPVASLPMYDWPEVSAATDALWGALATHLNAAGLPAPVALERARSSEDVWLDPALVLSQTCGYPFSTRLAGKVRLVATLCYAAEGCEGPRYSSALVTRAEDATATLADFATRRAAFNTADSLSGTVALRAAMRAAGLDPEAAVWLQTGSHRASVRAVAHGAADLAAIDAVAWALARRYEPDAAARLAVIGWTPLRPGLPLITARDRDADELALLHDALEHVMADPATLAARQALAIVGYALTTDADYAPLASLPSPAPSATSAPMPRASAALGSAA